MTQNPPTTASRADVPTDVPDRYAKQLIAHLGRKLAFTVDGAMSFAGIGAGTGQVIVGDGVLTLRATGPDESAVAAVEHVLGNHLERFGQREGLTVRWIRSADPSH